MCLKSVLYMYLQYFFPYRVPDTNAILRGFCSAKYSEFLCTPETLAASKQTYVSTYSMSSVLSEAHSYPAAQVQTRTCLQTENKRLETHWQNLTCSIECQEYLNKYMISNPLGKRLHVSGLSSLCPRTTGLSKFDYNPVVYSSMTDCNDSPLC